MQFVHALDAHDFVRQPSHRQDSANRYPMTMRFGNSRHYFRPLFRHPRLKASIGAGFHAFAAPLSGAMKILLRRAGFSTRNLSVWIICRCVAGPAP
jgi:hypothetical protein